MGSIHPKPRVSFAKLPREGVSDVLGRWIRNERPGMDPGEREKKVAGRNSDAGGKLHCRRHGGHRSAWPEAYGLRFENPEAPGESWGGGELAHAITMAGGVSQGGGRHGWRPKLAGACGQGARSHEKRN